MVNRVVLSMGIINHLKGLRTKKEGFPSHEESVFLLFLKVQAKNLWIFANKNLIIAIGYGAPLWIKFRS